MTIRNLVVIIFNILFNQFLYAQTITIYGSVSDNKHKPIEYASVGLEGTSIGTVSNTEGKFIFKIPIKYKHKTLIISKLGYENYSIKLPEIKDNKLNAVLKTKVFKISEIEVTPKDAKKIIQKAINKIPRNYPSKPIYLTGFYREAVKEEGRYTELAEAICKFKYNAYGEDYDKDFEFNRYFTVSDIRSDWDSYFTMDSHDFLTCSRDRVEILQLRKSYDLHKKYLIPEIVGGPLQATACDHVKYREFSKILSEDGIDNYTFKLNNIQESEHGRVYVINFFPNKRKAYLTGTLYINIQDMAFQQINYHVPKNCLHKLSQVIATEFFWSPVMFDAKSWRCINKFSRTGVDVRVKYQKTGNKWVLKHTQQTDEFKLMLSKHYKYHDKEFRYKINRELLITNILETNRQTVFSEDTLPNGYHTALVRMPSKYTDSVWRKNNIIKATKLQDSIRKDLENSTPLQIQFQTNSQKIKNINPPAAAVEKTTRKAHGINFKDEFHWMSKEKNYAQFTEYLEAENRYTRNQMIDTEELQRKLYFELQRNYDAYYKEAKRSDKYLAKVNSYYYWLKNDPDDGLQIRRSKKNDIQNSTNLSCISIFLNHNIKKNVYHIQASPDNKHVLLGIMQTGKYPETYIFNIDSTACIDTLFESKLALFSDNHSVLYTTKDRSVKEHIINSSQKSDKEILKTKNYSYIPDAFFSMDKKYIFITNLHFSVNNSFCDILFKKTNDKSDEFKPLLPKNSEAVYFNYYHNDIAYIISPNNKLYKVNLNNKAVDTVKVFEKERTIVGLLVSEDFLIVKERLFMQNNLICINKHTLEEKEYNAPKGKILNIGKNHKLSENIIQIEYASWTEPTEMYEVDLQNSKSKFISKRIIPTYDSSKYSTKLKHVITQDGIQIPITLIYRKRLSIKNSPIVLYVYGGYGKSQLPEFNPLLLSLLDRGIVFTVAHVRGGKETGKSWYESAVGLNKKKTFNDFITVSKYLLENSYTTADKLIITGGSHGGLVNAVAVNEFPQLYRAAILRFPMVDPIETLYFNEESADNYSEFENPENKKVYKYIKSYSPYQNIKMQKYPDILIMAGMQDRKIPIYTVAKYTAKLRKYALDNKTLLNINYLADHSLADRNQILQHYSFMYAYILRTLGITQ